MGLRKDSSIEIKEFKCPNCGGTLTFDILSQSMTCPFCDTLINAEATLFASDTIEDDFLDFGDNLENNTTVNCDLEE